MNATGTGFSTQARKAGHGFLIFLNLHLEVRELFSLRFKHPNIEMNYSIKVTLSFFIHFYLISIFLV